MDQRLKKKKISYPSFCKLMRDDFTTKLRVPPAFVKYMRQENWSREYTFSLKFGAVGGNCSWKVMVEKSNSTRSCSYYFTRGWTQMAKDVHLEESDFLVFYLVAKDAFQVAIFEATSGCAKTFNDGTDEMKGRQNEGEKGEAESGDPLKQSWFFKTLTKHQLKYFTLPRSFIREAKLCNEKKVVIKLDWDGKKWPIVLTKRKTTVKSERFDLMTGWSKFLKLNGIGNGARLWFRYVEGGVILFRVDKRFKVA